MASFTSSSRPRIPLLAVLLAGGSLATSLAGAAAPAGTFMPGEVWLDTEGSPIDAHGGGVLRFRDVYYWYGEGRGPLLRGAVACYSSTNLSDGKPVVDWREYWSLPTTDKAPPLPPTR